MAEAPAAQADTSDSGPGADLAARAARVALGVVTGIVVVAAAAFDLPAGSDGRFWSDAASYHAMAGSLAYDRDLEFQAADLERVKRHYPAGPQGVFLKRVPDGSGESRLVYAKAALYPTLAAPFVWLLGVDRGLLLTNALALAAALWLGYAELRRVSPPLAAAAGSLSLIALCVAPVYLVWETPELLHLGLSAAALVAFRRGRVVPAALLLGLLAYSKPTHLALALPLLAAPLVAGGGAWLRRALECARRLAWIGAAAGLGFGLGWLATGELNYQGGERKTFYDRYPFEPGTSFDSAGVWMTTDHVGPLVAGRDEHHRPERVAPPRSREELRRSFLLNLGYFWIGRFAGAAVYFPGFVAAVLVFLLAGPRTREGWLALLAAAAGFVGTILLIPDNWYGGAGTIGNRYWLAFLPLGFLLLTRRGAWLAAAAAGPATAVFLWPILQEPVQHSLRPGMHTTRAALRLAPAELTMLSDLSVFTEVWRKRRPYPGYFLWFLDDGTFGQESSFDVEGFWLRGGGAAQVVLQSLEPVSRVRLRVTAGPRGDIVTARIGAHRERVVLPPLRSSEIVFEPPHVRLGYYGTTLYLLELGSRFGGGAGRDERNLGSFVVVSVEARTAERSR